MNDDDFYKLFPSLKEEHDAPKGFVNWKIVDAVLDIICECGSSYRYKGKGLYHIECPDCNRIYECSGHIQLHRINVVPEHIHVPVNLPLIKDE